MPVLNADELNGIVRRLRAALNLKPPFTDSAAFHCQQAVEKYRMA